MEDVAAAQRFVGGGVTVDGCVVQGLLHEQVRHRRFRGHAFDEDALVEGMRTCRPTANVKNGQSASTLG